MPATPGAKVAELFISEAWEENLASRYSRALASAGRAIEAAERLGAPALLVRALYQEEWALRLLGDHAAALVRCTRMLTLAEDPKTRDQLSDPLAARAICHAYTDFVYAARMRGGTPLRDLIGVLDTAERWLTATGHRDWRAGVLLQRAELHSMLGETEPALSFAQEALAAYVRGGPGFSLAYHHNCLGLALGRAGHPAEAVTHFHTALDVPGAGPYDRMNSHRYLASQAMDADQGDEALSQAGAAIKLADGCGDYARGLALGARGHVYRRMRRYDDALADFDRAVELDQASPWVLAGRGETYRMLSRHDEAVADFDRAIKRRPRYAWAISSRAAAYQALGRYAEALADYDRAIALDPGDTWSAGQREQTARTNRDDDARAAG